jgi:hypothetical protein
MLPSPAARPRPPDHAFIHTGGPPKLSMGGAGRSPGAALGFPPPSPGKSPGGFSGGSPGVPRPPPLMIYGGRPKAAPPKSSTQIIPHMAPTTAPQVAPQTAVQTAPRQLQDSPLRPHLLKPHDSFLHIMAPRVVVFRLIENDSPVWSHTFWRNNFGPTGCRSCSRVLVNGA